MLKSRRTKQTTICLSLKYVNPPPLTPLSLSLFLSFISFIISMDLLQPDKYQIQAFGSPAIYRMIILAEDSSDLEEATFTVHGIILEKDLPPICNSRYVYYNYNYNYFQSPPCHNETH